MFPTMQPLGLLGAAQRNALGASPLAAGQTGGLNAAGMAAIGGGAPGLDAASLHNMGVSNSSLMLMAQINMMMASVLSGIGMLMQQIMAGVQQRQQNGGGTPALANPGAISSGNTSGGGNGATPAGNNTPVSSGSINNLSADRDTRLQQVVDAAKRTFPDNPVLAKLAATQAVLESGLNGTPSTLASQHNNLFGIKGSGTAGTVNMGTQEFENGQYVSTNAGFAKNATLEDSFQQYQRLIIGADRYKAVRSAGSFEDAARLVREAGYATDPAYTQKLINVYNSTLARYF